MMYMIDMEGPGWRRLTIDGPPQLEASCLEEAKKLLVLKQVCACQWIDETGKNTPDNNTAIGLAVCHDPRTFGEKGSAPFGICEKHAERIFKEESFKFWKLLPLEGQTGDEVHPLVKKSEDFRIIPDVVSGAIRNAFPREYEKILLDLRWSGDHWSFRRWGMYVGVEEDGYIHT